MFTAIFPITFLANTFAPTEDMPPLAAHHRRVEPDQLARPGRARAVGQRPRRARPTPPWPLQHPVLTTVIWSVADHRRHGAAGAPRLQPPHDRLTDSGQRCGVARRSPEARTIRRVGMTTVCGRRLVAEQAGEELLGCLLPHGRRVLVHDGDRGVDEGRELEVVEADERQRRRSSRRASRAAMVMRLLPVMTAVIGSGPRAPLGQGLLHRGRRVGTHRDARTAGQAEAARGSRRTRRGAAAPSRTRGRRRRRRCCGGRAPRGARRRCGCRRGCR